MSRKRNAREIASETTRPPREGEVVSWYERGEDDEAATCSGPVEWTDGVRVQVTSPVDGATLLLPVGSVVPGKAAAPRRRGAGAAALRVAARAARSAAEVVGRGARAAYDGARSLAGVSRRSK